MFQSVYTKQYKTWTLDSGLDCGLDSGLDCGLDSGLNESTSGADASVLCTVYYYTHNT